MTLMNVITGCMFAGKTKMLIEKLKQHQAVGEKVVVFRPATDIRYQYTILIDHDGNTFRGKSLIVKNSEELLSRAHEGEYRIVGVDEYQFFDNRLTSVLIFLSEQGFNVICAGLRYDFRGVEFQNTKDLLALPKKKVVELTAICEICGAPAMHTLKILPDGQVATSIDDSPRIEIGGKDKYKPVCLKCFELAISGCLGKDDLNRLLSKHSIIKNNQLIT
ncbi:MAG: hypothetical protein ABIJ81_04440 [Patescibacteria group bacterium]